MTNTPTTSTTNAGPNNDPESVMLGRRPMVVLTEHTVAALSEVLGMTEEFLRTAGPNVHAELRGYLRNQWPPADPSWLIDMLGFHSMHLHHQLVPGPGHQQPRQATSPRANWQPANDAIVTIDKTIGDSSDSTGMQERAW